MTAKKWEKIIKDQTKDIGTYKDAFDPVIKTLSEILAEKDKIYKQYIDEGSLPCVDYHTKTGAKNKAKNPLLLLWDELNKSSLAYWRDLGLTPSGLKKIDEKAMGAKKRTVLTELLEEIERK